MMTQLITAAPDLAAPAETPEASDSPDHSDDGFAILLTAICAAPVPLTTAAEVTEAAPTVTVAPIETAPSPLTLLPGDGLINLDSAGLNSVGLNSVGLNSAGLNSAGLNSAGLNSAGLTAENTASLPVPAQAAVTDTELLLQSLAGPDAAPTAIKSEVNPTMISSGETAMTASSARSPENTAASATPSAASAGAASNFPGAWWEPDGDEATAAQPLQAEAARRDLFSLASALAETNRQTRPPLIAASLSSFLAGRDGGDESSAKPTASSASSSPTAQAFNLEMAAASNAIAAGPQSASLTGQIISPMLAASDTLRQRETRTLRLNLQPEELGEVEVQITRHAAGQFSARLTAEHDFARQALADGLGQLRAALERAGLPVERLEVTIGPGLHFGSRGQAENQSQSQSDSQPEPRLAATGLLETEPVVTSGRAAQDRLLSLRA